MTVIARHVSRLAAPAALGRLAATAALGCAIAASPAGAAEPGAPSGAGAGGLSLGYSVYLGGLKVLEADLALDRSPDRYAVRLDAELKGMPALFTDWWAEVHSTGRVGEEGRPIPALHRVERPKDGAIRVTEMIYDGTGGVDVRFIPEGSEDDGGVTDEERHGSVDPLAGVIALMSRLERLGSCDAGAPVALYDGRRRFDLTMERLGTQVLEPTRYSAFAGEAQHCRARLEAVAGAFKDEASRQFWRGGQAGDDLRTFEIWIAEPAPGAAPVPVRIQGQSWRGLLIVHLTEARPRSASFAERPGDSG